MIFSNRNLWIDAIILDKGPISLFGATKMTLMVPSDVYVVVSFWRPDLECSPHSNGWCMNYFSFLALINCSKKSLRVLQSSVMWPWSWWYLQYRLWFHLVGSPPILFAIWSRAYFLSSPALGTQALWIWISLPVCYSRVLGWKTLLGLLGLKWSGWGSFHLVVKTIYFPLHWTWSSSTLLYSSILSINWCIS